MTRKEMIKKEKTNRDINGKEMRRKASRIHKFTNKALGGLLTIYDSPELLANYSRKCRLQGIADNPHDIIVYLLGMNNAARHILGRKAHHRTNQFFDEDIDLGD